MEKNGGSHSILAIIPALDEEEGIGPTLAELKDISENISYLVVDGNSTDGTVDIAKKMGAQVFRQEGSGKGRAIAQAIKRVNSNVKYVVLTDADFTYPAGYIPEMIRILEENPKVGMVTGNRFNHLFELNAMNNPFYTGNRLLAFAQRILNGVHLEDPLTGLRVVRWQILKNWEPKSKGFDIEAEMNHRVEQEGYQTVEIPVHYRSRLGKKKLKLKDGFIILRRIISESLWHISMEYPSGTDKN